MTKKARQVFSVEFKREAVRLLEQGDKDGAQLARELGIKFQEKGVVPSKKVILKH
jgi:transposase-like protein